MAGVINYEYHDRAMQLIKVTLTFASASQAATTTHSYYGFVVQMFINHDDSTQPATGWDLTVTDDSGIDVLNGKGANVVSGTDTLAVTQADLDNGMACHGQLVITGTNGGTSSGIAEIYLYVARYQ
jgi:hypothetical protein